MKKFKLLFTSLFLAMALLFVNISPVYADDPGNGPQGTSQAKSAPPQQTLSPQLISLILAMMRLW
jgi:hypothetical protein